MQAVTARHLARHLAPILDELERLGSPVLVFRNGQPLACLTRVDREALAGYLLGEAPEFARSLSEAADALAAGERQEGGLAFAEARRRR
jgi:antitoxin (DNA-binding transcriptional repressor) of toxin-antitoxin stability system